MHDMIEKYRHLLLEDEDGEDLKCILYPKIDTHEIAQFETKYNVALPAEMRDLLCISNGISWFGIEVLPLYKQTPYPEQGLLAFHSWGNGDFDCLALPKSKYRSGSILFMNHSPDILIEVEDSLSQWMQKVAEEIRDMGVLLHPAEYRTENPVEGVYSGILTALNGIDCELNRSS